MAFLFKTIISYTYKNSLVKRSNTDAGEERLPENKTVPTFIIKADQIFIKIQMALERETDNLQREHLVELLKGGFAPVVILLREFDFAKAGIALDGLPFSAWSLLEHMRHRQKVLLDFMRDPENNPDVWPNAYWPENPVPESKQAWDKAIDAFEKDLEEMIQIVKDPDSNLYEVQGNGKTLSWAAMTTFHHNAYTIGQVKAIGRQLGVW